MKKFIYLITPPFIFNYFKNFKLIKKSSSDEDEEKRNLLMVKLPCLQIYLIIQKFTANMVLERVQFMRLNTQTLK